MASKKSQDELEATAKVYQLAALETKIEALSEQVQRMNTSMDTLVRTSQTQITPEQLGSSLAGQKTLIDAQIREEIEKIHLEYRPLKKNVQWVLRAIGLQVLATLGTIFILYAFGGK